MASYGPSPENNTACGPDTQPLVSFVVPCYNLAHVLADCLYSILQQTYQTIEVIIMDDCSPDNTYVVANAFDDPRIRYIRNPVNLGNLANYNAGIDASRGKYVWLISADDRMRRPYVVERYVHAMELHPGAGFVCCPGVGLKDGKETEVLACGYFGRRDKIFRKHAFVAASLYHNYGLLSPSVMVRKTCYDSIGKFPLDMPHQGDWYLWMRWALDYDVLYFSEPMVNYRSHPLNMMTTLVSRAPHTVFNDEVNLLWRTKRLCTERNLRGLVNKCEDLLARKYARAAATALYKDTTFFYRLTKDKCVSALMRNCATAAEFRRMSGKVACYIANQHWRHKNFGRAQSEYSAALHAYWWIPSAWLKLLALRAGLGSLGLCVSNLRRHLSRMRYALARIPLRLSASAS